MIRVGFIGDVVGRPGREILKKHIKNIRQKHNLDYIIANGENASHGFGITQKNKLELISYGVDLITGGNHSFDKNDYKEVLQTGNILRPINFPDGVVGTGIKHTTINDKQLTIINLLGNFTMPEVDNAFRYIKEILKDLKSDYIIIDFHAETTAEKETLLALLKGRVSAICGTHTHIGTDDLRVVDNTLFVSDVGLSGCFDGVIGMQSDAPLQKAMFAIKSKYDIPKKCKQVFQMIVIELDDKINGYKIRGFDNDEPSTTQLAIRY